MVVFKFYEDIRYMYVSFIKYISDKHMGHI